MNEKQLNEKIFDMLYFLIVTDICLNVTILIILLWLIGFGE